MRILVIDCHPVETSYNAALHAEVVRNLRAARVGQTIARFA